MAGICSFLGKNIYIAKYFRGVFSDLLFIFALMWLNERVAMCKPLLKCIFSLKYGGRLRR